MVTEKQALAYYKNKERTNQIILQNIKNKGHIVYGARALNAHFPKHLDKHTEDWDVFSKTPAQTARRVEQKLDKKYGGDYFKVEPAQHPGTWKVKSTVTSQGVADYSQAEGSVPSKKIGGVSYVKLVWVKKQINKTLKDKESKYRWERDKEAMQRIKLYEKYMQRKKPTRRRITRPHRRKNRKIMEGTISRLIRTHTKPKWNILR